MFTFFPVIVCSSSIAWSLPHRSLLPDHSLLPTPATPQLHRVPVRIFPVSTSPLSLFRSSLNTTMAKAITKKKRKSSIAPLLLLISTFLLVLRPPAHAASGGPTELERGFAASPEKNLPSSVPAFQPLLRDPTGNYSLGFLVSDDLLDLAVVHVPSTVPLWRAAAALQWSQSVSLSFNGALALSDSRSSIVWSTNGPPGDRAVLLPSSNLQVLGGTGGGGTVLWQSFDHPADTIIQNQNFTSSMALISPGGKYSMRLGSDYLGLYMVFPSRWRQPMYWKEGALQALNRIEPGKGPIYARLNSSGFVGLYQFEGRPVHEMPFPGFNQRLPAAARLLRLSLERDGGLWGYYWNGTTWIRDYVAIQNTCNLPAPCGAYGLCRPEGSAGKCSCLNYLTATCYPEDTGSLCGAGGDYRVLRRTGVDLAYKEPLGYTQMKSLEDCEGACAQNCSCWGAVYHNTTGACYMMDFPIETMVADGGANKLGYFKVRQSSGDVSRRKRGAFAAGVGLLIIGVLVLGGIVGMAVWRRRRRQKGVGGVVGDVDGLAAGPYRDLKQTSSFGSMELTSSFRK